MKKVLIITAALVALSSPVKADGIATMANSIKCAADTLETIRDEALPLMAKETAVEAKKAIFIKKLDAAIKETNCDAIGIAIMINFRNKI